VNSLVVTSIVIGLLFITKASANLASCPILKDYKSISELILIQNLSLPV
jgi:hypothetical protein